MLQKRAYQYRFYPTAEQASVLARTFGCARFVYNGRSASVATHIPNAVNASTMLTPRRP